MREQTRTSHEMSVAVGNISKDALRTINANRSQLEAADTIRSNVAELRQITSRNADGVKTTLTRTSGLAERARELGEIMDSMIGANGTQTTKRRRTKKPAADERG
jgi:methyl-accepting chemotaxis protein